jgi:ubiquinone/menaquinone biosynthesis C-methylase UbiE
VIGLDISQEMIDKAKIQLAEIGMADKFEFLC